MIPKKIQALFNFIDYLDSNKIEYKEKYIPLCDELKNLDNQRNALKPNENYKDKQQYDDIQKQIKEKFSPIASNIHVPILNRLRELEIWSGDDTYSSIWTNNISEISDFKSNFKSEDVAQVMMYKQKYFSFRTETNSDFLELTFVFQNLDETLKSLFDFFKDINENEFDNFETKTIKANNLRDAVTGLIENRGENVKFSIPSETLYGKTETQIRTKATEIKNEIVMGDKIQIGEISSNDGQISIGKKNKNKSNSNNELAKKSFNWQKWGIIAATILAIIAVVVAIIVG
jgi:FtsZ-binding cell division protein ZapB